MMSGHLEALIAESGALQTGHFRLASGYHASRFFRCIRLFQDPSRAQAIFEALAERFDEVDTVLGANEAGSILAFELAKRLGAKVAIAREQHGSYALIEGFRFGVGERVLVADDVTTTGGTAKQLLGLVRAAQAVPVAVGLVATKGIFSIDLGCPVAVLLTLPDMDACPPEECPLCQQGIPLS